MGLMPTLQGGNKRADLYVIRAYDAERLVVVAQASALAIHQVHFRICTAFQGKKKADSNADN